MMSEHVLSFFKQLDGQIESSPFRLSDGACIQERDAIVDELLDNEDKIPDGIRIVSCDYESAHDPHHWIEVRLPNGQTFVWDRTGQKLKSQHFLPLAEAKNIWSHYAQPSHTIQVIPVIEE